MSLNQFKSKKVLIAIAGSIVLLITFGFQNCAKNINPADFQNAASTAPSAAAVLCSMPSTLTWMVGSNTCSATYAGTATIPEGDTISVNTGAGAFIGSASFTCTAPNTFGSTIGALNPGTSNSCASSCPTNCTVNAGTTWTTTAGINCTSDAAVVIACGSAGMLSDANKSTAGTPYGTATMNCPNNGGNAVFVTSVCKTDGVCGTDNGKILPSVPTGAANLCAAGTSSAVSGTGPWSWTCTGTGGGAIASCAATSLPKPLVKACTVPGQGYPAASGFLLDTLGLGNVCCQLQLGASGATQNGLGMFCLDAGSFTAAATPGPPTPLPAGSSCSFKTATSYPVGGGVITYTRGSVEMCCSSAGLVANSDGNTWYCEPSAATESVVTVSTAGTQSGTPCDVKLNAFAANFGITLYTNAKQRICCEIGAGDNGPGDGKSMYCEAY